MRRLIILLAASAALVATALSGAAPAATSAPTSEEFSQLEALVTKLETRVDRVESRTGFLQSRVARLEGRTPPKETPDEEPPPPVEEPPVVEPPAEEPPAERPVEEPPVVEPPEEAPTRSLHCFASPASCGFPDASTGASVATLTPSGSITASTPGQVIQNKDVTGQINIAAPNVTIRNVRVTATESGSGSAAISGNEPGLRVIDSTVRGNGPGEDTVEAAIRDYDGATMEGSNLSLCNECVQGWPLTVKDTYMKVSSIYDGAHAEDIYICSGTVDVDHSTLLNEQGQTATVFGDTICGGKNDYTVTNSLLAGGGFVFYPQANGSGSGGTTVITGNHIARCLTAATVTGDGHHLCGSGADSSGYYPGGGGYGVGAYFSGATTWSGNVWDDNGATIPEP